MFLFRKLLKAKSALILTYHRVIASREKEDCFSQAGMVVSDAVFRRQMRYLQRAYEVVRLGELIKRLQTGDGFERLCTVTFDDGWRDVYENAYPILRLFEVPATIFLSTGFIDSNKLFWPERIAAALTSSAQLDDVVLRKLSLLDAECGGLVRKVLACSDDKSRCELIDRLITKLKTLSRDDREIFVDNVFGNMFKSGDSTRHMLDWNEVREMQGNDVSFASHTVNHVLLTHVPIDDARREIFDSKQDIEKNLGDPSEFFAYPNGNWNDAVKEIVKDAGFSAAMIAACVTNDSSTDPFLLGRLNVHDGISVSPWGSFSRAVFACEISGFLNLFRRQVAGY